MLCNKCGQGTPHLSDSWCLACTSIEALGSELKLSWGSPGARAIASDLLVSCVRNTRALRRLSLSGAGENRAPEAAAGSRAAVKLEARSTSAAPSLRVPPAPLAPPPPPPGREVKSEKSESEEYESESSESGEGAAKELPAEEEKEKEPSLCPGTAAKSKADKEKSTSLPRQARHQEATGSAGDSRVRIKERRDRSPRRERSRHRRREDESERHHRDDRRGDRRKGKKVRRGGSKHQRFYRAETNPYKRFHQQLPERFWDEAPAL